MVGKCERLADDEFIQPDLRAKPAKAILSETRENEL